MIEYVQKNEVLRKLQELSEEQNKKGYSAIKLMDIKAGIEMAMEMVEDMANKMTVSVDVWMGEE